MSGTEVAALIAGSVAFLLCALYDWLCVRTGRRFGVLFGASGLLLAAATAIVFCKTPWRVQLAARPAGFAFWGLLALVFLVLLIKALFFSFPPSDAYAGDGKPRAVTTGLYGLCRHPGVLFLGAFYASVWLAGRTTSLFAMMLIFTSLDILLAAYEDSRVFPRILQGYTEYKKTTPFLLPDLQSGKKRK